MTKLFLLPDSLPAESTGAVVTVGNFDGVHLGHRRILERTVEAARLQNLASAALTFEPHPAKVLADYNKAPMILPYQERYRLLGKMGLDYIAVQVFTSEIAKMEPEDWAAETLARRLRARRVIVGYDFRFGRGAAGDFAMLTKLGESLGFETEQAEACLAHARPVSSSRIRRLVAAGEINMAADLLGAPFHLSGSVVSGDGRGRIIGFPTANLATDWELIPLEGVYACFVCVNEVRYNAAVNVGTRPTFNAKIATIEAHLIENPPESLYGKKMTLHFIRRLRGVKKFPSPDALVEQIRADVARAKEILASTPADGLR